jgi:hypothetical protein
MSQQRPGALPHMPQKRARAGLGRDNSPSSPCDLSHTTNGAQTPENERDA